MFGVHMHLTLLKKQEYSLPNPRLVFLSLILENNPRHCYEAL